METLTLSISKNEMDIYHVKGEQHSLNEDQEML